MHDLFKDEPASSPEREEPGVEAVLEPRPTSRPRRRSRTGLTLVITLALLGGIAVAVVLLVPPILRSFQSTPEDFPGPGTGDVTVEVAEGATGGQIAETLLDAGVVASREAFVRAFNANPGATSIQPGAYDLMLEMRASDAVAALLNPANRAEVRLTVVEGQRASQVVERIVSVTGLPLEEVEAATTDAAAIGLPAEAGGNAEGWLAAATYTVPRDATAAAILSQMVAHTVRTLDERGVPTEDRQAVLIKASIVEKEVNNAEDFGRVARVIENRLAPNSQTGGTLGMDSTIAFGLGKSGLSLSPSDLASDHPYNTRVHPGLPPGPIGSPGTAAIDAVLDPPEGDWIFFVTVNPDTGETRFTASYEEHLANQELYRAWLAQQGSGDAG